MIKSSSPLLMYGNRSRSFSLISPVFIEHLNDIFIQEILMYFSRLKAASYFIQKIGKFEESVSEDFSVYNP